jgi:hypothetical protein
MWISTITLDLVVAQAEAPETVSAFDRIVQKKKELQTVDGAGNSIPGFELRRMLDPSYQEQPTIEIKRAWNTQAAAEEFVNFANSATDCITGTVEEQV